MRWIWTRARCWRSRCRAPIKATRPRWMRRCAKPGWRWRSRSGARRSCGPTKRPRVNVAGIEETVTDKGYHSGAVVKRMKAYGVRSYIPEKKQKGRRNWAGKAAEQQAVYANRRRVRGEYGKSLLQAARRAGGAQFRALLRDGRHAALPSARTGKHSEAATGPCGRLQSEPDFAEIAGRGHATGMEKSLGQAPCTRSFAVLEPE